MEHGDRPQQGRGARGWRLGALAGATALCALLATASITVAASLVPGEWAKHNETLVLAATGLLAVVTVVLAVLSRDGRDSQGQAPASGDSIRTGDVSGQQVVFVQGASTVNLEAPAPQPVTPSADQIVVGELPGEPPAFVERDAIARLTKVFQTGGGVATVSAALTGERGIGKTQVAAQYARQAIADGVELVAWVSAESPSSLLGGLAEVAQRLGVADPDGDSERSAKNLHDTLATRSAPAVLVLDNAEDPELLRPYLPPTGTTRVIITSTNDAFASLGKQVPVGLFTREQSIAYLAERTELDEQQGANTVADELGDLPLALAQAASVIRSQGLTYPAYLEKLRSLPLEKMLPPDSGDRYPKGTARAILISVQAVQDADDSGFTGRVLATIAVLGAAGVDRELLANVLAPSTPPGAQLDETLARLVASSLLGWAKENQAVVMHRLTARAIRDQQEAAGELAATIDAAATALTPLLPAEEDAWEHRKDGVELVDQAIALWESATTATGHQTITPDELQRYAHLATWAVWHLYATADLSRAIQTGTATLHASEQHLGPDHPHTLTSRNNLAKAYEDAGNLDKAIPLFEENLADSERIQGTDHPNTLTSRNNLAAAYKSAGNLDKAIPLYEKTLADRERVLPTDHPNTLISRNNLAKAYRKAGHLDKALPLYKDTLTDSERALGRDHPQTLRSRSNLAYAYQEAGNLDKAITLFKDTLAMCEQVLAAGHPLTAHVRANLAAALELQRGS